MLLKHHGKFLTLEEVRQTIGPGARGTNLQTLLGAAKHYGFEAEAVAAELKDLPGLPAGSILHWDKEHFTVLERCSKTRLALIDPAFGRRRLKIAEAASRFSGSVLLATPSAKFVPEQRQRVAFRQVLARVITARTALVRLLLLALVAPALALVGPLLTKTIVDSIIPAKNYSLLWIIVAGILTFIGFQALVVFARSRVTMALQVEVDGKLRGDFVGHLLELPLSFFRRHTTGDLLSRTSSHATVRNFVTTSAIRIVLDVVMFVMYVGLLLRASWRLAAIAAALGALQMAILLLVRAQRRELLADEMRLRTQAQTQDVEMFLGIETIKAMGGEPEANKKWSDGQQAQLQLRMKHARFDSWAQGLQATSRSVAPMVLLVFGASQVMNGRLTLGEMLALNVIAAGFLAPLASLASTAVTSEMVGREIDRLDDVLAQHPEQKSYGTRTAPRLSGRVEVDNVSFRYGALLPWALDGIQLEIPSGALVAVVGPSGSGKSSLARLILGLYEPDRGEVRYDDVPLKEWDIRWLRRQCGVMTQQPHLFSDTVYANIVLGRPGISVQHVVEAAKAAGIHDDILALPHGYETVLEGRGSTLSGGQQQRIALARAFAPEPSLLLLDEATSQLDTRSEAAIWQSLSERQCTRIVVTHKPGFAQAADLVVVLDRGKAVEIGPPARLANQNGLYAELLRQAGHRTTSAVVAHQ